MIRSCSNLTEQCRLWLARPEVALVITRAASTSKAAEITKYLKTLIPPRKKTGTKFILPAGHMKASGAILCVVPIQGTVNRSDNVDDLVALKTHIKELLDVDGLLFWGASVNGRALSRNDIKEWLKLDATKTRPLVPSVLASALSSPLMTLDASGTRLLSQLEAAPQELIHVLTHMSTVKKGAS